MITILVVGSPTADPAAYAAGHPSVEILVAGESEEAIEKLARNRRIDAVLVLSGPQAKELAAALAEEDPSAPPIFTPVAAGAIPGARVLPGEELGQLLELLVQALESA